MCHFFRLLLLGYTNCLFGPKIKSNAQERVTEACGFTQNFPLGREPDGYFKFFMSEQTCNNLPTKSYPERRIDGFSNMPIDRCQFFLFRCQNHTRSDSNDVHFFTASSLASTWWKGKFLRTQFGYPVTKEYTESHASSFESHRIQNNQVFAWLAHLHDFTCCKASSALDLISLVFIRLSFFCSSSSSVCPSSCSIWSSGR